LAQAIEETAAAAKKAEIKTHQVARKAGREIRQVARKAGRKIRKKSYPHETLGLDAFWCHNCPNAILYESHH
jgi:hypothetical protein